MAEAAAKDNETVKKELEDAINNKKDGLKKQKEDIIGQIDQLDKDLSAAEAREAEEEEKATKEYDEQTRKEVQEKLKSLGTSLDYNIDGAFSNLHQRFDEHSNTGIRARQTDVLRLNKIVRDVSKGLGTEWKDVFTYIMSGTEKEEIQAHIAKIEKQRPVLQSFKAMTVWKESKEELNIEQLIEGLQVWGKQELADHVKAILYSEGDELLKIGKVPVSKPAEAAKDGEKKEEDGAKVNGETKEEKKPTMNTPYNEPLADRILLQLAKKIGPAWLELANMLGLAEQDIEDIKDAEGQTYQGAFKVLWTWRDRTLEEDINQVQVLKEGLKACSMNDVAELL